MPAVPHNQISPSESVDKIPSYETVICTQCSKSIVDGSSICKFCNQAVTENDVATVESIAREARSDATKNATIELMTTSGSVNRKFKQKARDEYKISCVKGVEADEFVLFYISIEHRYVIDLPYRERRNEQGWNRNHAREMDNCISKHECPYRLPDEVRLAAWGYDTTTGDNQYNFGMPIVLNPIDLEENYPKTKLGNPQVDTKINAHHDAQQLEDHKRKSPRTEKSVTLEQPKTPRSAEQHEAYRRSAERKTDTSTHRDHLNRWKKPRTDASQ